MLKLIWWIGGIVRRMKIALFGGCFNPIHYGHLILAETAREYFHLDKIIFIPSGKPPHKSIDLAPSFYRYQMVKLAIANNKYFSHSPVELKRKSKSYTYRTIEIFKKKYPKDEVFFLVGSDTLFELDTWKKGRAILEFCQFIVGTRPGFLVEKVDKDILGRVSLFPIPGLDISGQEIRERTRQGESIKYLVPEEVEKYIYKNKLYREGV